MPDALRRSLLGWGLVCVGVSLALGGIAVEGGLDWLDQHPVHMHGAIVYPLRWVEIGLRPLLVVPYAVVVGLLLWWRHHRRAAIFAVVAVVVAVLVHDALAPIYDRPRPAWQYAHAVVHGGSYPSGHATAIAALAAVLAVLTRMLVRRRHLRTTNYALLALLTVAVCLDRVLLGRHHISDVVGGVLLGGGVVLLTMAFYSPLPRSHAVHAPLLLDSHPRGRRLAVVLNPIKVESVRQFRAVVIQLARESGWDDPDWYYTTVVDSGTGMAADAAASGADLVLVCGGDGTVREVCAELAGTGIAVGIIPAGTGNLLARNLGIPLYLRSAVDVALTGQDKAIDLVEVTGDQMADTHFLVMAGMGFDAAIMEGVDEGLKKRIGWLAYVVSGAKGLMFPAVRLEISIDDGPFTRHRARTVVVGNVGTLTGGMPLLPDARIDDGLLDVVLLHPRRFLSWLPLAWRVLARRPHTDDLVNRMTGHTVAIRADRDTPRELDGDTIGAGREMRMSCIHGRLLVRVPR